MDKERVLELIQELNEKQTETICIEAKTANKGKPEKDPEKLDREEIARLRKQNLDQKGG